MAVIYVRISQDPTGQAAGVQRQERECRALSERLGLTVERVYADNDVSAASGRRRPAFERLLAEVPKGGVVVCWHTDRLVRRSKDLERVLDRSLTVHAVTAGTLDLATPAGRAVARTLTAWAQFEGEQKGERQRARNRQDAEAGRPYWRHRPFGYELDGSVREPEAEAVRDGSAAALASWTLGAIARDWNSRGLTTSKGAAWHSKAVGVVLKRPLNAALRTYGGVEQPGAWEPLIPEATWRSVVSALAPQTYRGHKVASTLLAGIATCDDGHKLYTNSSRGRRWYRCWPDTHRSVRAEVVDGVVIRKTATLLTLPGLLEALHSDPDDGQRQALLTERRALVQRRDTEVPQMLAAGLSVAQVAETNRLIGERLAEIATALDATAPDDALAVIAAAPNAKVAEAGWRAQVWDGMALEAQRATVRALWRVVLTRDGAEVEPTELCERLAASVGAIQLVRPEA